MQIREFPPHSTRAHELLGDYWFHGEPVIVSALAGSVLLVAFWDSSSFASLRVLPYVSAWHRKYEPFGLVTVGVHIPQFAFGRDPGDVQRAMQDAHLHFPVVSDNDGGIAARYDVRVRPTLVLVDRRGYVRAMGEGEGSMQAMERLIQGLLHETGLTEDLPWLMEPLSEVDRDGALCYRSTPDLFAGYARGSIGNVEGLVPESVGAFRDPGLYLDGRIYVQGTWLSTRQCLTLEEGDEGQVILDYQGSEVVGVLGCAGNHPVQVTVQQDEHYLTEENRGLDVCVGPDGRSTMKVGRPRLYSVVRNREHGEHLLRLTIADLGVSVYAFSFGTSVIPELVSNN